MLAPNLGLDFDAVGLSYPAPYLKAPTWVPTDLGAQLLGFLDFENNAKITTVTGAISQITDNILAANWTQGTSASRPLLVTSAVTGRQVAKFDGVDDYIDNTPANAGYPLVSPMLWALGAVQLTPGTDATARYLLAMGGATLATQVSVRRRTQGSISQFVGACGAATTIAGPNANSSPFAVCDGPVLIQQSIISNQVTDSLNNIDGPLTAATPPNNSTRGRLGAQTATVPSGFWLGELSFVLFLNAALAADQQNNLNIWTAGRLGLR